MTTPTDQLSPQIANLGDYAGLLIIGDPHVSSRKPGRRTDDFLSSVLDKLSQAAEIARKRNLLPIITGDLIHRENESDTKLIHRLLVTLQRFPCAPFDIEGNHGKGQSRLGEGDIESLLHDAGVLRVVSGSGVFARLTINGEPIQLAATPHGQPLPTSIPTSGDTQTVLITHHDLAFGSGYPGAIPMPEIENCRFAINGHMHKTYEPVQVGQTLWHCPGNIEPLSIDVKDHKPAVWELSDLDMGLFPHFLKHAADCFDLQGLIVPATDAQAAAEQLGPRTPALPAVPLFLAELQSQSETDRARTDDASAFREDVKTVLDNSQASEAARAMVLNLLDRALRPVT